MTPLTLQDVLDLLPELASAYAWCLDDLGMLRAQALVPDLVGTGDLPWDVSPLTALAYALTGQLYDPWLQWDHAATAIGLPVWVASGLVSAEDRDQKHDRALRAQLLQALGIREGN